MDRSRILGLAAGAATAATIAATAAGLPFVAFTPLKAAELRPWTAYEYWRAYPDDPKVRRLLVLGGLLDAGLLVGGTLLVLQARGVGTPGSREHDARFATETEIEAAGLLAGPVTRLGAPGLLLGAYKGRWVVDAGDQHVGLPWPSGAGKTRGFLLPNLLNWTGSCVVLDLMEILYARSGGWRSRRGDVFVFRPLSDRTHCFNPLDFLPTGGALVTELQEIMAALVPMSERDEAAIWKPSAQTLGLGLLYYLIHTPGQRVSFGRLARLVDHEDNLSRFMFWLMEEHRAGKRQLPELCRIIFSGYLSCAHETREGYRQNLRTALGVFLNPYVDAATSTTSPGLDPRRLRERTTTLYLSMPVKYLGSPLGRLMSLIFDTVHSANLDRTPAQDPSVRVPLWMGPDEVGQMPRLHSVARGLTAARNFAVRWCLPFQDTAQMRMTYGAEATKSLLNNCDTRLVAAPNDDEYARAISQALGPTTRTIDSRSTNRLGASSTQTERGEPLVWPHEIMQLPREQLLVIARGRRPFYAQQINIDANVFADRLDIPPPELPRLQMVDHDDIERVPEEPDEPEAPKPRRKPAAKAKPDDFDQAVADALGPRA